MITVLKKSITIEQAADLIEKSSVVSVLEVGGMKAQCLKNEEGAFVLVQASGDEFLLIA